MEPEQPQTPTSLLPTQHDVKPDRQVGPVNSAVPTSLHASTSPTANDQTQKPVPDQATIDALLQVARADQERRSNAGGTRMHHWWDPGEWVSATPAMRKSAIIKVVFFIISSIVLTVLTNYVVSHAGKK